jgi:hypothetical protein
VPPEVAKKEEEEKGGTAEEETAKELQRLVHRAMMEKVSLETRAIQYPEEGIGDRNAFFKDGADRGWTSAPPSTIFVDTGAHKSRCPPEPKRQAKDVPPPGGWTPMVDTRGRPWCPTDITWTPMDAHGAVGHPEGFVISDLGPMVAGLEKQNHELLEPLDQARKTGDARREASRAEAMAKKEEMVAGLEKQNQELLEKKEEEEEKGEPAEEEADGWLRPAEPPLPPPLEPPQTTTGDDDRAK